MKYIKKYESEINIKIGDYVICNIGNLLHYELDEFLMAHIGEVVDIDFNIEEPYIVMFDGDLRDYPELKYCIEKYKDYKNKFTIKFTLSEIKYSDSNKENLEILLVANKYNL